MTSQEKDRFICKKLGRCWHELIIDNNNPALCRCSCGATGALNAFYLAGHVSTNNPDFTSKAGRVELLKLIKEQGEEKYNIFITKNYGLSYQSAFLLANHITNDNSLFRDTVFRWFGGE